MIPNVPVKWLCCPFPATLSDAKYIHAARLCGGGLFDGQRIDREFA